ncbi:aldehyde dehydrogenase family protein [Microbacterium sp. STN6]|uniref:aldehyde dehydrogenase family protein n=1 Tax=Microbacterium sp. STN6 TaxID=2995588 RepID=UPI002260E705|nr:aldehyde dehydrogenase family protein [Microbacterium sp. STN6]MCX7523320.1 aldehyde dehydrogenase family protein [Microbacterium sp. STN6]
MTDTTQGTGATHDTAATQGAAATLRAAGDDSGVYIGGWAAGEGESLTVEDKATGETLARLAEASRAQLDNAVTLAVGAQRAWAADAPEQRARVLEHAADVLEAHREEYVRWLVREAGSAVPKAQSEIAQALDEFRAAADLARADHTRILPTTGEDASVAERVPHGVVGVITPWNVPLVLAMRSVAPALALGNAVVLKPDHQTPVSGGLLLARVLELAGLPAGVFSVVPGRGPSVGEALVQHPDVSMVSFTGSTRVGRQIAAMTAPLLKKVALELGGKSPHVVLADADVEGAAESGAWGTFLHQGQICMAAGRHVVDESVAERYVTRLAERARSLRVGDPAQGEVDLGPLINRAQAERVAEIIEDARANGATVVAGGEVRGQFVQPTVLAGVRPGMRAYAEEIFGPVAVVVTAAGDDEAVRIANDTEYGLSASVHSASIDRANRVADRIRSGMVHINGQPINDNPWAPMGGVRASGSGGRFGGESNVDMFTTVRWRTTRAKADLGHFPGAETAGQDC